MKPAYSIIKSLLHTEKSSTFQEPQGKYLFLVDKGANKLQIKKAVEEIYKVNVVGVNTVVCPGKAKRVRHQIGRTPDYKRAQVTLKPGQKISEA